MNMTKTLLSCRTGAVTIRNKWLLPVCNRYLAQPESNRQEFMMHPKILTTAALLVVIPTLPARAQTMVDMSLISCDQFLKSPSERKAVLSSWMGGYFSSMKNQATIRSEE